MSNNTDFNPLAGPYYPRKRNRADAIAQGLAVVLAGCLYGVWRLVQMLGAFAAYLLGPKP